MATTPALKPRKSAPRMSANERSFVKKQALGMFITGKPAGRPRRPSTGTRPLISNLRKANGQQSGSAKAPAK